ncbi:hypothetical protein N8482_02105 [Chitinophagales bacterium]|nr:hypothetical protein [Chitinophagales bacterium]
MKAANRLKSLRVISLALLAGAISFAAIVYFLLTTQGYTDPDTILQRIGIAAMLMAVVTAPIVESKILNNRLAGKSVGLDKKIDSFATALIVRLAMIECATIINIVFYLLSGDVMLIALSGAGIVGLLMSYPRLSRVVNLLQLTEEEERELQV